MINFKRLKQQTRELNLLQDNVEQAFVSANKTPFIRGKIIKNIAVSTTAVNVATGIEGPIEGWVLVDIDSGVYVYRQTSNIPGTLNLIATGSATISIWVF